MVALTCEYAIQLAYCNFYNLDDEDSLNADGIGYAYPMNW